MNLFGDKIRCTYDLFTIVKDEVFMYDPATDEYYNSQQSFSRAFIELWENNFENVDIDPDTGL